MIGWFSLEDPFLDCGRFAERCQSLIARPEAPVGFPDSLPGIADVSIESKAFGRDTGRFLENIPTKLRHLERQSRVAMLIESCREIK